MLTKTKEKTPDAATSDVKNMEIGSPSDSIIHHSELKCNRENENNFSISVTKLCSELEDLREAVLLGESPQGFYRIIGDAIRKLTILDNSRVNLHSAVNAMNESIDCYRGEIDMLKRDLAKANETIRNRYQGKYIMYIEDDDITNILASLSFISSFCGIPAPVYENLSKLITYLENLRGDKH